MAVREGASFLHTEIRSDSDLELAQPWGYGEDEERPAFSRRPIVVGFGLLTFCAATVAVFLAFAQLKPHGFGHGHGQVRDLRTAAAGMTDLEELVDAVQADLHGVPDDSLGSGLSDLLSEDSNTDPENASKLLDEGKEERWALESPGALSQSWVLQRPWQAGRFEEPTPAWQTGGRPQHRLYTIFNGADKDESGFLEGDEIAEAAHKLHTHLQIPVWKEELITEVDAVSDDGKLGFKEFKHAVHNMIIFQRLDKDHSGAVDGDEIKLLIALLDKKFGVTPPKFRELQNTAGVGPSGSLRPVALARILAGAESEHLPAPLERVFDLVDKDKSGQIEGAERGDLSWKLRRKSAIPAGEYAKLEKMADNDANGAFGPEEFKKLVVLVRQHSPLSELPRALAQFFSRADENADGAIAGEAEIGFISKAIKHQFHLSGGVLGGLIKEADKSGDDRLEPLEFLHLVHVVRNHAGNSMSTKPHRLGEGAAMPETPAHVPRAVARDWERIRADQPDQAKPKLF